MTIKPYNGKILVLPLDKKEEKIGGVIIPGTANADLREGKVIEVSDDLKDVFKQGEIVLFPEQSGLGQVYKGQQHLWLRVNNDEIWGVVSETE